MTLRLINILNLRLSIGQSPDYSNLTHSALCPAVWPGLPLCFRLVCTVTLCSLAPQSRSWERFVFPAAWSQNTQHTEYIYKDLGHIARPFSDQIIA